MKKQSLLVAVLVVSLVILVTFSNISNAAMLTYSFDDGHISVYSKAYSILGDYGQVGTANVISNTVKWADSGVTTRVNSTQLREMQDAGWEICSHSKSHPRFSKIPQTYNEEFMNDWVSVSGTNYTYKANYAYEQLPLLMEDGNILRKKASISEVENSHGSYYFDASSDQVYVHTTDSSNPLAHEMRSDSVQRELEMSKIELTEMGLDIQNFIVPYSDWSENRHTLAREHYNSVGAGYHNGWVNDIPPDDPYWLARMPVSNTIAVDDVKGWVEDAIAEDQWLILMFHMIGDGDTSQYWSEENFQFLTQWVSAQDILVVTQQEGIELAVVPIPSSFVLLLSGLAIICRRFALQKMALRKKLWEH